MSIGNKLGSSYPRTFTVPQRLNRLTDLAYNLWWTWGRDAEQLFRQIDLETWEAVKHNPILFLARVQPEHLERATGDKEYLELYDRVIRSFDAYMSVDRTTWYARNHEDHQNHLIAYFCSEYGFHETLPFYAGGLGILAADHIKEASDLGIPMTAIGLLYEEGYFIQRINEEGRQEAYYAKISTDDHPLIPVFNTHGERLNVKIELPGRDLKIRIWRLQVGRVPFYLLDGTHEKNQVSDRSITARLYRSDRDQRIIQEMILGIGGVRALRAMGVHPTVWHLNEGHSGFLTMERARELTLAGLSFDEACEKIYGNTVFTTHTPVPAGHEKFPHKLMDMYFEHYFPQLNLDRSAFIGLGSDDQVKSDVFNMTAMAMRMSKHLNGVSKRHGQVTREMWSYLWPDIPVDDVPIQHITNGVHLSTWLAPEMRDIYDKYLGHDWEEGADSPENWEPVLSIPDDVLWEARLGLKLKLLSYLQTRRRLIQEQGRISPAEDNLIGSSFKSDALTIGFARRFTTYKRAGLLFSDLERLIRLVNNPDMPIQVIIAGKAHPADEPAKKIIQEIFHLVRREEFGGRIVLLEDYDIDLARHLVQGVDVWLNTPLRPNEASGTSGQKAALNGGLNLSMLDGWWLEGFNGRNGWAFGDDTNHSNPKDQDAADADSFYQILEEQVVPLYYQRSPHGIPEVWLEWVRQSIMTLAPRFNTRRMMKDYIDQLYLPAQHST
jgi:starch phosphorylase